MLILCVEAVHANLDAISKYYLSIALNSDQTGSAFDYVDALLMLTKEHPTVWTVHYKSKTPVDRRLRQFLKKGSQLGPRDYWGRLRDLFGSLPKELIPATAADAAELLSALHSGITRKDESRINLETAYATYLEITFSISKEFSDDDERKLLNEMVLPMLTQYLHPSPDYSQWNLPSQPAKLFAQIMHLHAIPTILQEYWPEEAQRFINDIKTSAPEQSKGYEQSQRALIQQASRFATIQEQGQGQNSTTLCKVFSQSCSLIVSAALTVTKNRNGKPYGAIGVVAELLHRNGDIVLADEETRNQLNEFLSKELPGLILSPSATYLVDVLYSLSESTVFEKTWTAALKVVLKEADSTIKGKVLEAILTSSRIPKSFDLATFDEELQHYIRTSVRGALEGSQEWDSFNRILQSPAKVLSKDTTDEILSQMTQSLSISQEAPYALHGLRQIVKQNPAMLKTFLSTPQGSNLLQSLLLASESPNDEISQTAASVSSSIQTVLAAATDTKQSVYGLIQQGLQEATSASVSVETLVELAKQLVKPGSSWEELKGVFPSNEVWESAFAPFLTVPPKASLSIVNPLAGAIYLVGKDAHSQQMKRISRDADGYSAAYRITQYVTKLFKECDIFPVEKIPVDQQQFYLRKIALAIQLADDNLGLAGANGFWVEYSPDVEADAMSFISEAQSFVTQELKRSQNEWSDNGSASSLLSWATDLLAKIDPEVSTQSYYYARAYSVLISDAIEICGWKNSETAQIQELLKVLRKSKG